MRVQLHLAILQFLHCKRLFTVGIPLEELYMLPCAWNFRASHCHQGVSRCKSAVKNGVSLLHGSMKSFFTALDMQDQFVIISDAIRNVGIGNYN